MSASTFVESIKDLLSFTKSNSMHLLTISLKNSSKQFDPLRFILKWLIVVSTERGSSRLRPRNHRKAMSVALFLGPSRQIECRDIQVTTAWSWPQGHMILFLCHFTHPWRCHKQKKNKWWNQSSPIGDSLGPGCQHHLIEYVNLSGFSFQHCFNLRDINVYLT